MTTTTYTGSDTKPEILIFKTNITSDDNVRRVAALFKEEKRIQKWTIDRDDIDNVLRIEASKLTVGEIILLVRQRGFYCEELED